MNLERVMPLGQDLSGKLDDIPWHHSSLFIVWSSFQSNFYKQLSSSFMIIIHYNILSWDRKIIISTVSFFFFFLFGYASWLVSSLTRDSTWHLAVKVPNPNQWTSSGFPIVLFFARKCNKNSRISAVMKPEAKQVF